MNATCTFHQSQAHTLPFELCTYPAPYAFDVQNVIDILTDTTGTEYFGGDGHNDLEYWLLHAENFSEEYNSRRFDLLHLLMHGTYTELQDYFTSGAWKPWFADSWNDSLEYAVAELLSIRADDQRLHQHIISDCWTSLDDAVACLSALDAEVAA